ncbi:insulin-induced protein-domain-containing protein [Hypomontagnella monticulosa]|nr:insulin-induced protein-domain-containing protein [Hypomontagnella monticulosa]
MSDYSGPPLLRPIPRRPFDLKVKEPTPPDDDPFTPATEAPRAHALNLDTLNSRLLNPRNKGLESASISRAQSVQNLTSSALMGIYSPTIFGSDRFGTGTGTDEPSTPWGTGAETPAKHLSLDSPLYDIQKERAQPTRRRSSLHPVIRPQPLSTSQRAFYLGSRGLLLFSLGTLYGILVAQLRDRRDATAAFQMEDVLRRGSSGLDWSYMAFWGTSGVVMGGLLPWFDGIWERAFGQEDVVVEAAAQHSLSGDKAEKESASYTDWALAVRGIGAFVGIAFAIRKLPWDSTLQVSLTLALVNPVLWFLIDRSIPGFLLSVAVGLAGSSVLMGLKPDMMPTPANPAAPSPAFGPYGEQYGNATTAFERQQQLLSIAGFSVSQETLATGIWLLSVLFCCCVCFGNIGRWLALNRGTAARGRWAERR